MEKLKSRPKDKNKYEEPKDYKVIFLNDDYTSFGMVTYIIAKVFHKDENEAKILTVKIHQEGQATVGVYTYDIATTKQLSAMAIARQNQMPLVVVLEEN